MEVKCALRVRRKEANGWNVRLCSKQFCCEVHAIVSIRTSPFSLVFEVCAYDATPRGLWEGRGRGVCMQERCCWQGGGVGRFFEKDSAFSRPAPAPMNCFQAIQKQLSAFCPCCSLLDRSMGSGDSALILLPHQCGPTLFGVKNLPALNSSLLNCQAAGKNTRQLCYFLLEYSNMRVQ